MDGWSFKFEAPPGQRIMKRFWSCTTYSDMWYSYATKTFVGSDEKRPKGGSTHSPPIRSFKAFRRFLRKHPELKGVEVILVSRYLGHSVTAEWKEVSDD